MVRLGLGSRITCVLGAPTLLYAVGQGALAIEIRTDDKEVRDLVSKLVHRDTDLTCRAERACLRMLEGGCSVPVGVNSAYDAETKQLSLTGAVTALDGSSHVELNLTATASSAEEAEELGTRVATQLMEKGAKKILEDVSKDRADKISNSLRKMRVSLCFGKMNFN